MLALAVELDGRHARAKLCLQGLHAFRWTKPIGLVVHREKRHRRSACARQVFLAASKIFFFFPPWSSSKQAERHCWLTADGGSHAGTEQRERKDAGQAH